MLKKRKAQGMNAAILVTIIAALIIIYVLFLPTEEREDLLGERGGSPSSPSGLDDELTLLDENVGLLSDTSEIDDRNLPDVYLFETTESQELVNLNPVYVKNNIFGEKTKTVSFALDNLENTDDVLLTFSAPTRKGVLAIKLNNNIIYEYNLNKLNVDPISIKKEYLAEQNTIEFNVDKVGLKFWRTNEYSLENVKMIGDITDRSRQASRNIFTLTKTEIENLEKATIRFIPYCSSAAEVGILDVLVNNRNIFSALPLCDDPYRQDIPAGILEDGENKVIFKTDKGSYSIENIKVELKSEDTPETVFWFEINESLYTSLIEDERDVTLKIRFIDDDKSKKADMDINDHIIRLDQKEDEFTRNLNPAEGIRYITEGNNYIRIVPKTTLNIIDITVVAEEE